MKSFISGRQAAMLRFTTLMKLFVLLVLVELGVEFYRDPNPLALAALSYLLCFGFFLALLVLLLVMIIVAYCRPDPTSSLPYTGTSSRKMNSWLSVVLHLLLLSLLALICYNIGHPPKYRGGKTTYRQFGDGRFELGYPAEGPPLWLELMDNLENRDVLTKVTAWKESDDCIFAINSRREAVVVNYITGVVHRYATIDQAPPEYKRQFDELLTQH